MALTKVAEQTNEAGVTGDRPAQQGAGATEAQVVSPAQAALEARLARASARARELGAQGVGEATTDDLAGLGSQAQQLDVLIGDVNEALRQVFVAGLAFPAAELPSVLEQLADRARAHRLATGVELLDRLGAWVAATLAEPSLEARQRLSRGAWDEAQRLVTWARLFRAEHDLLTVQSRLAAPSAGAAAGAAAGAVIAAADEVSRRSMTVFPVGIDLAASGKLIVFGVDGDGGAPVVLADHLSDVDATRPLARPVISRMFQGAIDLRRLATSVVRLDEHPAIERGGVVVFRPAFRAIPRLHALVEGARGPTLARPGAGGDGATPDGVYEVPARVRWVGGRAVLLSEKALDGVDASLGEGSWVLRANLVKLLVRERSCDEGLSLVARRSEGRWSIIAATTGDDGRVFVACDPSLFTTARAALQGAARAALAASTGPGAGARASDVVFLCAATHALGGASVDELGVVSTAVSEAISREVAGIEQAYRLALAAALVGVEVPAERVRGVVEATLRVLVAAPSAVDAGDVASVLGVSAEAASAADARVVRGEAAYRAVWLAMGVGLEGEVGPSLAALLASRYGGELRSPSVADVCARALLLLLVEGDEARARAVEFVEAHVATWLPSRATTKTPPLPDAIELLQIGDTLAVLRGEGRWGETLRGLAVPRDRSVMRAALALARWRLDERGDRGRDEGAGLVGAEGSVLRGAADELLVLAAEGIADLVVG